MKRWRIWLLVILFSGGAIMAVAQQGPPLVRQGEGVAQSNPGLQPPPPPVRGGSPSVPPGPGTPPPPPGPPGPPGTAPPPPGGPPVPPATLPPDFLQKASRAVETAGAARALFTPGPVWIMRAPGGEVVIKAAILYQGVAVGALEFSPVDGALLPRGYHPRVFESSVTVDQIKKEIPGVLARLQVLQGAEYREPEACWAVPLAVDGKIVAHLKVYYDGVRVVPDYPVDQEMRMYGK